MYLPLRPAPGFEWSPGTRVPLLAGACGRLVLASWPLERRQAWLRKHPLPRFTEHSLTDSEQFWRQ